MSLARKIVAFEVCLVVVPTWALYLLCAPFVIINFAAVGFLIGYLLCGVGLYSALLIGSEYWKQGHWPSEQQNKRWQLLAYGGIGAVLILIFGWFLIFPVLFAVPCLIVGAHWTIAAFGGRGASD